MSPLYQRLQALQQLYLKLLPVLAAERSALTTIDTDGLGSAVSEKQQVLSEIHDATRALGPQRISVQIAGAASTERPALEELAASLKHLATEAQESNRVNGKVVARSQKSLRELMAVLHGQQPESIYGEHGEPRHLRAGAPVAQA